MYVSAELDFNDSKIRIINNFYKNKKGKCTRFSIFYK